jgi:hypothetical protein
MTKNYILASQSLFFGWQEAFMVNLSAIGTEDLIPTPRPVFNLSEGEV